jgi:hypothetical protein
LNWIGGFLHLQSTSFNSISGITKALDLADIDLFPNIYMLLTIAASLPVTTCECKRSFSTIRQLNSYLRASQSPDRHDALALNIHCSTDIDIEAVIDLFAKMHPRRMELSSVLID